MRKIILSLVVALSVAMYSPQLIHSATTTMIRVRDSVTQNFLPGASVTLFNQAWPVFSGITGYNGEIVIDRLFNGVFNAMEIGYQITMNSYRPVNGQETFYVGQTRIFDLTPQVFCGDGVCTSGVEDISNCPRDCGSCGDHFCITPPEDQYNCPVDCLIPPIICGQYGCQSGETCSNCAQDCGVCPSICGDGVCSPTETNSSCPTDCFVPPRCGDGKCNGSETCKTCAKDCRVCPSPCPKTGCVAS